MIIKKILILIRAYVGVKILIIITYYYEVDDQGFKSQCVTISYSFARDREWHG
jgi:hypothetical protein